jgi:alkyl hydroperoxide reductase subunit AhpC
MSVARVTRPAPDFTAEALLNGSEFGTVKLSDYRGKVLH